MPKKKTTISDAERAKRIREAAREHETDNDPASFERVFAAVARAPKPKKQHAEKERP
jgi:hypothetical protein